MLNAMNETTVLYESPYETLPGEKPHGDTESVTYRSTSDMVCALDWGGGGALRDLRLLALSALTDC